MTEETESVMEEEIEKISGFDTRPEQFPEEERIPQSVGKFGIIKIIFSRKTAPHALSLLAFLGLIAFLVFADCLLVLSMMIIPLLIALVI